MSHLEKSYPKVYEQTEHYEINNYGLVFRLKGENPDLNPILFLSHYDVVPAWPYDREDSLDTSIQPPFSGVLVNGRIYGRGTLDMKGMLFSLMESMDNIIAKDIRPKRDIYLAFGFDEEVGGLEGASRIAEDFKSKGLYFDAVYDEGGIISTKGSIQGIDSDIALIGCAEKGFLSARVTVKGLGGHSSMPPLQSAIGKAAIIMQRLESDQMKPMIIPIVSDFLNNVGGMMPYANRLAIANQWLLKPVLLSSLEKNNATNALTRTTTALTMMKGSDASNVLAPEVEFVVNFRILPGNSVADVRARLNKACEGFEVTIEEVSNTREASQVSPTDTRGYAVIKESIHAVFPDAVVTPYLTIGGTDAYKYETVSEHVYRFMPVALNAAEQQSIHNTNESISIENFSKMYRYFELVMQNYDKN